MIEHLKYDPTTIALSDAEIEQYINNVNEWVTSQVNASCTRSELGVSGPFPVTILEIERPLCRSHVLTIHSDAGIRTARVYLHLETMQWSCARVMSGIGCVTFDTIDAALAYFIMNQSS